MVTARGGFLERVDGFDPEFFAISAREAVQIDPQQRLALELAWEALEHAGVPARQLRGGDTGVFMGAMWTDYEKLHALEDIEQHSGTGWHLGVVPGRVSHALGLRGPSMAVNTACSSSLVAVHLACQALLAGETALALAGGVSLMLTPHVAVAMSKFGGTSVSGRCFAYDARADGYVRGEGGGVVVLRRYEDALAAGDRILALIRATAVNNDGESEGLTVPSEAAQATLLREVYERAGVDPGAVTLIEGHGTGTPVGDPIEARAIGAVLRRGRSEPVWLGSIKPNIGHTEAASGVASLIKVALALDAGLIPPNRNFERPNPAIDFEGLGLRVPTSPQPWRGARLAGVNSFGFGGTNCHVVLAGATHTATPQRERPQQTRTAREPGAGRQQLIALSAHQAAALDARLEQLRELAASGSVALEDLAHTLWHRRSPLELRAAVVAASLDELVAKLDGGLDGGATIRGRVRGEAEPPALVFAFSGQGSQWVEMGRELLELEPAFRAALASCSRVMEPMLGWSVIAAIEAGELAPHLEYVDGIQPAIYAMQVALAETWRAFGVRPDAVVGHSMGEVAAAVAAGALGVEDGARITCARASLLRRISGAGGMLSVALSAAQTEAVLAEDPLCHAELGVAVDAGAGSTVVSGGLAALARLREDLEARGVECRDVAVDVAAHSPQIDALADELFAAIADIRPRPTEVRMISSVTGAEVEAAELTPAYWVRNLRDRVRFAAAAELLFDAGYTLFLEVSPHPLLTWPLRQLAKARGFVPGEGLTIVGCMRRARSDHEQLLGAAAHLHCRGVPLTLEQPGELVDLPAYPWQRRRFWPKHTRRQEPAAALGAELDLVARFDPERVRELAAHGVAGRPIVAAGVVLELVLRARAMLDPQAGPVRVEELEFVAPISARQRVRLELASERFTLAPEPPGASPSVLGKLAGSSAFAPGLPLPDAVILHQRDAAQHYRALSERDVDYGPELCAIESLRLAAGFASARVRPRQTRAALLDACFQTLLAAIDDGGSYVTAGVEVACLDPARIEATHEIRARITREDAGAREGRVCLLDEAGEVVAVLEGIRLAALRPETSVLQARRWRALAPPLPRLVPSPAPGRESVRRWLILGPEGRATRALSEALYEAGLEVQRSEELDPSQLEADLEGVLLGFAGSEHEHGDPFEPTVAACERLVRAARACIELHRLRGRAPRVVVVSERAQAISARDRVRVGASAAIGLVRVALAEHPELKLRTIDLGELDDPAQRRALALELDAEHAQPWLALRPARRGCDRLAPVLEPEPVPDAAWEPRAGSVIVSGGLGGIGRVLVTWLVERGVDRVVILGRRSLDAEAEAFLRGLEARGPTQLCYLAVDVAELEPLRAALAEELPRCVGVLHSAAVLSDAPLREHGDEQLRAALRPKLRGAWNLHTLTRELPRDRGLDFFVMFGSLGGWIGLPGQASYAAANAALDGLAEHRRGLGLPALSVGWCGWEGLGFARSAGGAASLERLAADGIGSLTPSDALALLEQLLASEVAPVVAVMPPPASAGEATLARAEQLAELRSLAPARRRAVLDERVLAEVAAVLREEPHRVDPSRPLRELGLDSLMSVELAEHLARATGLETSTTTIWQYPTVEALVAYFVAQLEPPTPPPVSVEASEDELEALVDQLSAEEVEALTRAL